MNKSTTTAVSPPPSWDYPFAGTTAQHMLSVALERAFKEKRQSQRFLAKQMGYKSSVVLSHMALGRVAIPIDRVCDLARYLGMDQKEFLLAVIEQRHPEIDFKRLFGIGRGSNSDGKASASHSMLVEELEAIAGVALDNLPMPIIRTIREVVADNQAPRRWIQPHEISVVEQVRRCHPDGLLPAQLRLLKEFVAKL